MPVFGEPLDDDIMSTAGQLAERAGDSGGAMIEAIYVHEIPMSLPLDARLPGGEGRAGRGALAAGEAGGRGVRGREVEREPVRGRTMGAAIVEEARERRVEAIVIGAEPPSRIKGGGLLGGIAGAASASSGR